MAASFVDLLPPEYQRLWGAAAGILALGGLLLWTSGVKVGRLASALVIGALGAGAGAWVGMAALGVSGYTGGLTGLAVGVLLGAMGYRLLLPAALAVAVTGVYLRWQAPLTSAASRPVPATVQASDLEINIRSSTAPATSATSRPAAVSDAWRAVKREWSTLPPTTQTRTTLLFLATLVGGVIFALLMLRRTAMVITACLGSLAMFLGIRAVINVYARQYAGLIPASPLARYAILGGVAAVGVLIQYRFFRLYTPPPRPPKPPKVEPAASK